MWNEQLSCAFTREIKRATTADRGGDGRTELSVDAGEQQAYLRRTPEIDFFADGERKPTTWPAGPGIGTGPASACWRGFGRYDIHGRPVAAAEIQAAYVGTGTMSPEDYQACRAFDLTISIFNNAGILRESFALPGAGCQTLHCAAADAVSRRSARCGW